MTQTTKHNWAHDPFARFHVALKYPKCSFTKAIYQLSVICYLLSVISYRVAVVGFLITIKG